MKINEVTYLYRKNLGNFEHEELSASVIPTEGTGVVAAGQELKSQVKAVLNGEVGKDVTTAQVATAPAAPSSSPSQTETSNASGNSSVETPAPEGKQRRTRRTKEESAPSAAPAQATQAQPAASTMADVPKTIAYDRTQANHQNEVAAILGKLRTGWATDPKAAGAAKSASEALVGKPFLNALTGEVLPTFQQEFLQVASLKDPLWGQAAVSGGL